MSAVLRVNCALADASRDRSPDRIRFKLEKSPTEFSEELGEGVMFLEMLPLPLRQAKVNSRNPARMRHQLQTIRSCLHQPSLREHSFFGQK
jgi:hypothetical protein